jgi:hypothetical protein
LSGTGFSLCGFDLWQAKVKRTLAEACATGKAFVSLFDERMAIGSAKVSGWGIDKLTGGV